MEKTITATLKSLSAVVYVVIFLLIFSLPVIFIYQAFQPPVFVFDSVAVEYDFQGDGNIPAEEAAGWQKIEFSLICKTGKFSPYSFNISKFDLSSALLPDSASDILVTTDGEIYCDKDTDSPFTLTLYVKDAGDINNFVEEVSFRAVTYEKSFGEFSLKFVDGKAKIFG